MTDSKFLRAAKFHHITLVVRDVDETVAFYEAVGIGPWHNYPPLEEYVELIAPDQAAFYGMKVKWADLDGLQLQLVEPGPGLTPHGNFLRAQGEGVFSLGFDVADVDMNNQGVASLGLQLLIRGRRRDGSGFAYLDTAGKAGGVALVVRQKLPASR